MKRSLDTRLKQLENASIPPEQGGYLVEKLDPKATYLNRHIAIVIPRVSEIKECVMDISETRS